MACFSRACPYPLPLSSATWAHFCISRNRPPSRAVANRRRREGPLAADLSNCTRRADRGGGRRPPAPQTLDKPERRRPSALPTGSAGSSRGPGGAAGISTRPPARPRSAPLRSAARACLANSPVATADCASFRRVGANYGPRRVRIGGLALGFHDARALAVRSAKLLALEGSAAGARPCSG